MRTEVRWEHMFPDELEAAFARRPLVFLPYGLCEPHGPQNTVGCDGLRAHAICCAAARAAEGIVAPVHYWHLHDYGDFSEWAHKVVGQVPRAWLTPVPPWIFFRVICYQLRAVENLGFHAALIYSGHGGPHDHDVGHFVEMVQPHLGTRLAFVCDIDDLRADPDADLGWADHAGRGETSMLWAVEPGCVDMSRLPPPDQPGPHFAMGDNAREADRRRGEAMIRHKAAHLAKEAARLLAEHDGARPAPRLTTYAAVERLWHEVVAPALPAFSCMKGSGFTVPAHSVWHANWQVPEGLRP